MRNLTYFYPSILKTLVESGEMILSDGRRIVSDAAAARYSGDSDAIIKMHPDFRLGLKILSTFWRDGSSL